MVRFKIECELPFSQPDFWRIRASPGFLEFVVTDGLLKKMQASESQYQHDGWCVRRQRYCPAKVDCPPFVRAAVGDTMFEVDDEQRWNDQLRPYEQESYITPSFLASISRTKCTLNLVPHPDFTEEEQTEESDNPQSEEQSNEDPDEAEEQEEEEEEEESEGDDVIDESLSSAGTCSDTEGIEESESSGSCAASETSDDHLQTESPQPLDPDVYLKSLPFSQRSMHVVTGETKVSILTLGWFIERSIVHNLRLFYKHYPAVVCRFRQKLYDDFANGDTSVPCQVVVDRFLQFEAQRKQKLSFDGESLDDSEISAAEEDVLQGDDKEVPE